MKTTCSFCNMRPPRVNQRTCKECHAAYQRKNRPKYSELSEEQKRKDTARSILSVNVRRGKIQRKACEQCGSVRNIEGHHPDYSKPLEVIWMCRICHRALHYKESP